MPVEASLPVELWEAILREASVGFQPPHPWIKPSATPLQRKRWRASMLVKRRIVLVCKQWYYLGMPLLHEHIVLTRWERTSDLAATASRTSSIDDTLGPLGRFTSRLDVSYRNKMDMQSDPLSDLIRELPNLLTFTIPKCGFRMSASLLASLAPTLEHLELNENTAPSRGGTLHLLFDCLPNLRIASIPPRSEVQGSKPLLACQQLFLNSEAPCPVPLSFPSLEALGLEGLWSGLEAPYTSSWFRTAVNAWACTLTSLFLDLRFLASPSIEHHIQYALERCPRLEELFITTPISGDWLFPEVSNSKVRLLGVKFHDQLRAGVCNDMFALLCDAKSKLFGLKVIRLFDERDVIHLRKSHAPRFRCWVELMQSQRQILLQDHLKEELVF